MQIPFADDDDRPQRRLWIPQEIEGKTGTRKEEESRSVGVGRKTWLNLERKKKAFGGRKEKRMSRQSEDPISQGGLAIYEVAQGLTIT